MHKSKNLNIHVEIVCGAQFQIRLFFLIFIKEWGWKSDYFSLTLLEPQSEECELFGNKHSACSYRSGSSEHFHCTSLDHQFVSTSLFFLNSNIICLMLKMASVLYVISILTWHHQLPLMTLRTVSFFVSFFLQLQDPDVRSRNAFTLVEVSGFPQQSLSCWLLWDCQQNSQDHTKFEIQMFSEKDKQSSKLGEKHISYASNYKPGKWQAVPEQIVVPPFICCSYIFPS